MIKQYRTKILFKPGNTKEEGCFCNYYNPKCSRGYKDRCVVLRATYNPFRDIEECQSNTRDTYKKVHGRIRQK